MTGPALEGLNRALHREVEWMDKYLNMKEQRNELLAVLERLVESSEGKTEAYRQHSLREARAAIARAKGE